MIDPQEMADVAWILAAMTVVLLMFAGKALFYGGMSGRNNVLNMLAMTMSTLGTVTVLYVLFGHSLVLGDSLGDVIGDLTTSFGLVGNEDMAFYTMFAGITVAIVASGALGLASGAIVGLVVISPAADGVDPFGARALGLIAAAFDAWASTWKTKLGIDESLDAWATHGIGGIVGALFVVFFGWATLHQRRTDPGHLLRRRHLTTVG